MRADLKLIDNATGLFGVAREIAQERRESLLRLCDAVLEHEYEVAEGLARELKGQGERTRIDKSLDSGAGSGR